MNYRAVQPREYKVDAPQEDAQGDRDTYDHDGQVASLLACRPGDLAQLGCDRVYVVAQPTDRAIVSLLKVSLLTVGLDCRTCFGRCRRCDRLFAEYLGHFLTCAPRGTAC